MKSENLQYQIIANSSASDAEVSALNDAAIEAGLENVPIQKIGGTTALGADGAPEVILLLKYAGGALAGGILAAIGADVWKNIKKFVTTTFKKYKDGFNPEEQWFYNPIIVIDLKINEESKVQIHFPRHDEEELKKSVESLQEIFSLYGGEDFIAFKFDEGKWIKTIEKFKNQEQLRDEIFQNCGRKASESIRKNRHISYFHLFWLFLSIFAGWFLINQIPKQKIYLPAEIIRIGGKVEEQCADPYNCDVSRPSNDILKISEIPKQLESFDNFFPLSVVAGVNITASTSLDSNAFLEVTEPHYSERIRDIKIRCGEEESYRFDSKNPKQDLGNIKLPLVNTVISKHFTCSSPGVFLAYSPKGDSEKIVVAPNAYVKIVTQGNEIVVTKNSSILLELDTTTKTMIFLIVFFLSLVAGSILYSYLIKLGAIYESKAK